MSAENPVRVRVFVSDNRSIKGYAEDTFEIDRAEWDEMSPKERSEMLDDYAQTAMENRIDYGWRIDDPEDAASTEDGTR